MDLGQNIRKGVKWLIIGNTGQKLLEFVFGIVLARLLLPADFGLLVTIQAFTGFVGMLTSGGMAQALVRAKEVTEEDFHAVFTMQMVLSLLIYLGFWLVAPWFAEFFENPIYEDLLRVSTLVFLLRPFAHMHGSWLIREMDFKRRTQINVSVGLVSGISSILMAWSGLGVWSLVLSGLVGAVTRNLLLARSTPLKPAINFALTTIRRHGAYGSKVIGTDLLSHLNRQGLAVMLSKLAGPSFLGLFNKADSLHRLPYWSLGQPLAQPLFRAMAKVQDDLDKTKYMYYRAVTLLMVYVLPFFMGLMWIGKPFIQVVYGPKWIAAGDPMQIMAVCGFFYIVARPCAAVLMAQNRLGQEMIAQTGILLFTLTACLIGLQWGLVGVGWAFVASQAFAAISLYTLVYRILPTRLSDLGRALQPGLILNGLLLVALLVVDRLFGTIAETNPALYMLLMGGIGAPVYIAAFFLLPIPTLASETSRWSQLLAGGLERFKRKPV